MTLRKEFFFSIVASVAVLSSAICGGDGRGRAEIDFAQVETLARAELRGTKTPGAVIGVIQKDRLILAKGVGVANVESGAPVTADMLFHIGSVTKMFTAAAVAILAEEGKVKLNAPIGNYARGLSQKISELTAQELLSQTSGLKDIPGDYGVA
jgi:D-alanyl-D-alanine carboxypeptidase